MGARREGRELAVQALYSHDYQPRRSGVTVLNLPDDAFATSAGKAFASDLLAGVAANLNAIDAKISEKSKNWALSRMARVDLSILRLAVFELLFRADIPKNVSINEAIELAKKFGTEDSPAFVNGILDEVAGTLPDKE